MSRLYSASEAVYYAVASLSSQSVVYSRPLASGLLGSVVLGTLQQQSLNLSRRGLRVSSYCLRKDKYVAGEMVRQAKLHPILKFKKVIVVDENGINLGEMQSKIALGLAEGRDMRIVKVNQLPGGDFKQLDKTSTPIFRIASGQILYQEEVAEKKKVRKAVDIIKEVHIGTKITDHDMSIKIKHIKEVLEKGKSVRVFGEVKAKGKWIQPEEYQSELDKRAEKLAFVASSLEGFAVVSKDPKFKGTKEFVLLRPTPELITQKEQRVKETLESLREKRRRKRSAQPVDEKFLEVMGKELEEEMVIEEKYGNIDGSGSNTEDSNESMNDSNESMNDSNESMKDSNSNKDNSESTSMAESDNI